MKLALAAVVTATLGFGQAINGITAANAVDIGQAVTNVNVTIDGPDLVTVGWGQRFTMNGSLSLPGSANPGDTFTWQVPHQVSWQKNVTLEVDEVKLIDVVIEGSIATFTLRPEVANIVDRTVGFSFSGRFKSDQQLLYPPTQVLQVVANGQVVATKTVTTRKPPLAAVPGKHSKQLWFNADDECRQVTSKCLTAAFTLQAGDHGVVNLVDPAGDSWRFNCATLGVSQNRYTATGVISWSAMPKVSNLDCSAESLSLTLDTTGTPDDNAYYLTIRLDALVPGGTGLINYENAAKLQTKDGSTKLSHAVQSAYVGGYVIGSSIRIRKMDGAGNDANEQGEAVELPNGETKLRYAVVNNGDQPLTKVKVTDRVLLGDAKVKNLKCVFPDKTEGTEWEGPFKPQSTFACTADLSGVVGYHQNEASVTVIGVNHEPITRTDTYWAHKHERVAVGNKVWIDANRNGKLDDNEPGKGDVTLTISRSDGEPVTAFDGSAYTTTTTTNADGDYKFENLSELPAGVRYIVSITYPAGYIATQANVGGDEGVDNNSSTDSATSTALTNDCDKDLTLDFGLVKPLISVGDRVWMDTNRNGKQDNGENPVADVTVKLYDASSAKVAETTTNSKGFYSFTNLIGGDDYTIEFDAPESMTFTIQDAAPDEVDSDVDPATGKVSFTAPVAGNNSADNPDNPDIDAGLLELNLTLTKQLETGGTVLSGDEVTFTLTPSNNGAVDALAGWSVTDLLPGGLTLTGLAGNGYTCDTGTVTCVADATLAAGATGEPIIVTATVNVDATGTLHNVAYVTPAGSEIIETNPLVVPTTGTDTDSTDTDNDAQANVMVTPLVSVGDYVWWDVNRDGKQSEGEEPAAGVTVKLYNEAGTKFAQTVTSETGFYSFTNLTAGVKYTVAFVAPEYATFTIKDNTADEFDSDADPVTGTVSFTAPVTGINSATTPDNATLDAGLLKLNLTLTKQLETKGAVLPGNEVTFTLTPANEGPVDALAGWTVADVLPKGLTLKSIIGDDYICDVDNINCTAEVALPAGATGNPVTVTAVIDAGAAGELHNVAYVEPSEKDISETNPLGDKPVTGTNTDDTETDNDAQANVKVSVPIEPKKSAEPKLAITGAPAPVHAGIAVVMLLAGVALIVRRRHTVS